MPVSPGHAAHTLRVSDLSVTFRSFEGSARVVDRLSLEVNTGELIGIVGETGCGKSVLMRALLDLLPNATTRIDGKVEFDGVDLRTVAQRVRRATILTHFNMVFQDPVGSLNPVFTIGNQLYEVLIQAGKRAGQRYSKADLRERAAELLRRVQLDDPERVLRAYPFQ
ncbi:MAG: oligopeptide/dipeptide transporter, ATPase subunit, partial [Chloroflexi bacterium]|nr:oligopeptide/dipeptide transporter, ATPase subunit [Chloroflexota bacterium]